MTTGQYINFMADNNGQDNFWQSRSCRRQVFPPAKSTEINSIFVAIIAKNINSGNPLVVRHAMATLRT